MLLTACALGLAPRRSGAAAIPEPATIFYGRITGTGSAQSFPITEGTLEWILQRPDGRTLRLTAPIRPVKDSGFAYRLNVPHHALALGTADDVRSVGLKSTPEAYRHLEIRVNGQPAILAGPSGASFDAAQARRAATFQLDLEVPILPADSDGNGLPDWWQAKHELTGGASADPDQDGVTNADEYRLGTDPNRPNRQPTLRTSILVAYADGTTGVALDVVDSDSALESLTYVLTRPPTVGELRLRNGANLPTPDAPDKVLAVGATFTQEEILQGRLIYRHPGGALASTSFGVTLRDLDPSSEPVAATVEIRPFRPATAGAAGEPPLPVVPVGVELMTAGTTSAADQRVQNHALSRDAGFVIWDWSAAAGTVRFSAPSAANLGANYTSTYLERFGKDHGHVMMGGTGDTEFVGGMEGDVLIAGLGSSRLRGLGGRDRFVVGWGHGGEDQLEDFSDEDGDVLDLSRVVSGISKSLSNYVKARVEGNDVVLDLDADGVGGQFQDRHVRLKGRSLASIDLAAWLDDGRLLASGAGMPARIQVSTPRTKTGEEEAEGAAFLLTRTGLDSTELQVDLSVGGSALNGSDYAMISSRAIFRVGERSIRIVVQPFADSLPEAAETVELVVLPGANYTVGAADRGRILIEDWQSTFSISTLDPFATLQPLRSGLIRITSGAPMDRPVEVLLNIGGTAEAGTHYLPIRRSVAFAVGQSSATLEVLPVAGTTLPSGAATVEVSLVEDGTYRVGSAQRARVLLVDRLESFAAWRALHFPDDRDSLTAFGARDLGGLGIPMLARYAFGLDPHRPDHSRVPRPQVRDGYLTLDVVRRPAAADVEMVVEVSNDLMTWESTSARVQEVRPAGAGSDPSLLCFRALPAVQESPRQFMRVRIQQRP